MKSYNVSYLLSLSRYPDHFYSLNKGLEGRDRIYKNPGTSLRSFVVGCCLTHEIVEVGREMFTIINECEAFCRDQEVIKSVDKAISDYPYELAEKLVNLGRASNLSSKISSLNTLNRSRAELFHQLELSDYDLFSDVGSRYKQSLIDIKDVAISLENLLESLEHSNR